jgi:predicted O-methyltransferase YrrM
MEHFWHTIPGWSTYFDQGMLLKHLLPKEGHLRLAEVGVYHGRCTAMWVVELLNAGLTFDYYAIDHFQGQPEIPDTNFYEQAVKNLAPIASYINIINMESVRAAATFADGYFDIVYIDADHHYQSVKEDIASWYPKVRPGGCLCGDDYVNGWPGVVRAVDELVSEKGLSLGRVASQQWFVVKPL